MIAPNHYVKTEPGLISHAIRPRHIKEMTGGDVQTGTGTVAEPYP